MSDEPEPPVPRTEPEPPVARTASDGSSGPGRTLAPGGGSLAFAPGCLLLAGVPVFLLIEIFAGLSKSVNCDPSRHTCPDPPAVVAIAPFVGLVLAATAAFLAARWRSDEAGRSRRRVAMAVAAVVTAAALLALVLTTSY